MAYTKYSLTPANNTATPPDGAPEGMLPSAVNDTMRDMMAQIRDCGDGIRDGTYTMTAAKITGGTITGVTLTGNTFSNPTITGVSTFAAGTVSAPAITTSGDTNTGIFFPAADTIAFTEGGVERMRIDSAGHAIVGYTSSVGTAYQTNMQVKGGGTSATYAGYGLITSNNESAGLFGVYSNTENSLWIAADPDNLRSGSRTVFTVDGTQTAQINQFGIGVGSATPTSGTGITFPATQSASSDANTLDDYEEGTWTPTVTNGYTGVTYSTQNGNYTKVGRLVHLTCYMQFSGTSSANTIQIQGLPFTPNSNTTGNGGTVTYWDVTADGNLSAWCGSSAIIQFYKIGTSSGADSTGNVTNKFIIFSMVFFV